MITDTTPATAAMRSYTKEELAGFTPGQLITIILTGQRRMAQMQAHIERLESVAGASTIRNVRQCPTCRHESSREVNQGRERRCERCKTVWAVE